MQSFLANVTLGRDISEERVWQALETVQLAALARGLSEGIHTRLGEGDEHQGEFPYVGQRGGGHDAHAAGDFQKKASDPRSDPRATVGKVVLPRPILTE